MATNIPDYWSILGIWIYSTDETPDAYALLLNEERDVPLMDHGKLILFRDIQHAQKQIDRFAPQSSALCEGLERIQVYCEPTRLLEILSTGKMDDYSCVVDTLNAVLDILAALPITIPDDIRHTLHRVADHMTFSRDLAMGLVEMNISKHHLQHSVFWATGAILMNSKIVQ